MTKKYNEQKEVMLQEQNTLEKELEDKEQKISL